MKWYNSKGRLIYGQKTINAASNIWPNAWWLYASIECIKPLQLADVLEKYNLMTTAIMQELQDYIFVGA
jgi:hypothetical protein